MWGIFSNHPLDDPEVYDDDWILHASDQDYEPYYRPLNSLDDTTAMEGNVCADPPLLSVWSHHTRHRVRLASLQCAHAGSGFGRNEMYPCFDADVTYGLAVKGLAVNGTTLPVSITTDGAVKEPNVRMGAPPKMLTAKVTVSSLSLLHAYTVFRYDGTDKLPSGPPFDVGYSHATSFRALGKTHTFEDPHPFSSDSAVYYVAVANASALVEEA